ncbi:MAG: (2Fe-2S)-binding protein [Anaerolineae bacterium]|nr:(2Fe-2S)-binding protein [Anaerolineae bacterium]
MKLEINGKSYDVDDAPERMLLWVVRDELGLIGTKFGCGAGICGSCTLHLDGVATRACVTPVSQAAGKKITTIEGLATNGKLHPVQQAWLDVQVPQCSWCQSGQMMAAAAFLNQTPKPTEQQVVDAMNSNYCRCGCYTRIKAAVLKAAEL